MADAGATSAFTVRQVPPSRTFRVQSYARAVPGLARLSEAIGASWPGAVGVVAEGRYRVLCIGPTDWVVVALTAPAAAQQDLESAAREAGLSLVEVTDALPAMRLSGPEVREVLSQGCGVDLHARALAAGQCVRTRLAQVPVIVHCTSGESTFDCYISRSYCAHFVSWLAGAIAS